MSWRPRRRYRYPSPPAPSHAVRCGGAVLDPSWSIVGVCTRKRGHPGRCGWDPRRDPTDAAYRRWPPSD